MVPSPVHFILAKDQQAIVLNRGGYQNALQGNTGTFSYMYLLSLVLSKLSIFTQ